MITTRTHFGRYLIRSVIAHTGMSTVYEGWDERIARRVAIKAVSVGDPRDPETRELLRRFNQGAQAAGMLNHPHIVAVYDYAEQDDLAYLVMEFVDGLTLKAKLDGGRKLPTERVATLLGQVLAGLEYSHSCGIVHRDIKPANIMITGSGQAKITDFGIARIERSDLTQAGDVMGSPPYMSPEQFRGDPVDHRTDIYSVGVMLYEMLAGSRPFKGSPATIMHKALNTEAPIPSSLAGSAVVEFDPVVHRAMAKRREERFSSAREFADAVQAAAARVARRSAGTASGHLAAAARAREVGLEDKRRVRSPSRGAARGAAQWRLAVIASSIVVVMLLIPGIWFAQRLLPRLALTTGTGTQLRPEPSQTTPLLPADRSRPGEVTQDDALKAPIPGTAMSEDAAPPLTASPGDTGSNGNLPPSADTASPDASQRTPPVPPASPVAPWTLPPSATPLISPPPVLTPPGVSPPVSTPSVLTLPRAQKPPVVPPRPPGSERPAIGPQAGAEDQGDRSGWRSRMEQFGGRPPIQQERPVIVRPRYPSTTVAGAIGLVCHSDGDDGTSGDGSAGGRRGAEVTGVTAGGAGERSGIRLKDLIQKVNGQTVSDSSDCLILEKGAGRPVSIEILRSGQVQNLFVTIAPKR